MAGNVDSDRVAFKDTRHVTFPPGSGFLLLPVTPARAARAGLALYDTVNPRQRLMLTAGTVLARVGLHRFLPTNRRTDVDWSWWEQVAAQVVEPLTGPAHRLTLRLPPSPFAPCGLFHSASGQPLAFVKGHTPGPDQTERHVLELLQAAPPAAFRTPTHLAVGELANIPYRVLQPLPEGAHRAPPHDPERLWRIIDEFRAILAPLARPPTSPADHVPAHGDLHVRNVRIASDGHWWLFDWERVRWAPPLSDELRYWSSVFAGRVAAARRDSGTRVLALLRRRGTDADVEAALRWPAYQPKRPQQQAVYRAVAAALDGNRRRRMSGGRFSGRTRTST